MRRKPRGKVDPIERQIEVTLRPGEFIHDRACISFASGLEKVAANIGKVTATEPARSVTLCEAFLAGCLDYRLATQFTSFEAAEEQVVTSGGKSRRVEVPVNMPEGISDAAVFGVPGGVVGGVAVGAGANPTASQGL